MALQKQPVNITFHQGVQTKVDPFQLPIGAFASLQNAVFNKDGLLQKRNGYELLTSAPTGATTLCTLNQGLVLLGQTCESYSDDNQELVNAGVFQPCDIRVKPVVRYAASVWQMDSTLAANGLCCTVFFNATNSTCYYNVVDSDTGQVIVPPTLIGGGSWPRCEAMSNSFVILYTSSSTHLNYFLVPFVNPAAASAPVLIYTGLFSTAEIPYDSTTFSNNLYIHAHCNDVGGATRVWKFTATQLDQGNIPVPAVTVSTDFANLCQVYITVDPNNGFPIIWCGVESQPGSPTFTFFDVFALNNDLTSNLGVTLVNTFLDYQSHRTTMASSNTVLTVFYNKLDGSIATRTVTLAGAVGSERIIIRGLSLVSKALDSTTLGKTVFLAAWGDNGGSPILSTPQATDFLIDEDGNVLARLAQNNAYGAFQYPGLPKMQEMNSSIYVSYLYADITTSATSTNTTSTQAVAAQYGVNLAQFSFNLTTQGLEIGNSLHASGGFLWQYDGQKIVEHGFHLFPEGVTAIGSVGHSGNIAAAQAPLFYVATYEWIDAAGLIHRSAPSIPFEFASIKPGATFTGTSHSSTIIDGISPTDIAKLQVGQEITGPGISGPTWIVTVGASGISVSLSMSSSTTSTFTVMALSAINVIVPTYRVTYKTENKVRIVIYRWSTTLQTYHQITDINAPILNNPAIDSVTFTDTFSDAQIEGNNELYTTGGVIENIPAPGSPAMTLWQSRLFMVDAEDRNLIWFSKPVIEATPVEMSDAFTLYIAPTTGAQGSTGDITALFSMDDKLLIFKKDALYYITGTGPDITGANNSFSDPIFITGTVGCDNPRSLVLTPQGVMFQSDKGIWLLGRDLQTMYIGAAVESYTQGQIVTSALCIPGTNQVRFTLDNLTGVMYDYFFQRWSNWNNINAISSVVYAGVQAYLNTYNQVVVETPGLYKDLSHKVLLSLTTGWINLAGLQGFERFYQLFLLGQYIQPFALNVQLAYDYNPSPTQSTIVTPEQLQSTWGSEAAWGTGGPWGNGSNAFEARVFPDRQKCESFQVTINELAVPGSNDNGAGLTLSGMNLIVGMKRGYRTQAASRSFGK